MNMDPNVGPQAKAILQKKFPKQKSAVLERFLNFEAELKAFLKEHESLWDQTYALDERIIEDGTYDAIELTLHLNHVKEIVQQLEKVRSVMERALEKQQRALEKKQLETYSRAPKRSHKKKSHADVVAELNDKSGVK